MTLVGVDTVRLSIELHGTHGWRTVSLDGGGFMNITGTWAAVEASLPRRLHGTNLVPLDVSAAHEALIDLIAEAKQHVDPLTRAATPQGARITRLDLVRDFHNVPSIPRVLSALSHIPQSAVPKHATYRHRGQIESLVIYCKTSWTARMYDKFSQSGNEAASGQLRCEFQLRERMMRRWARDRGGCVKIVADLTESKAEQFAEAMFDELHLGRTLLSTHDALHRVASSPLGSSDKTALIGLMTADHYDVPLTLSRNTIRKYKKLAEDIGVQAADLPVGTSLRLDWPSGTCKMVKV